MSEEDVKPAEAEPKPVEAPEANAPEAEKPTTEAAPEGEAEGDGEKPKRKNENGSDRLKRQRDRLAAELATERSRREELERGQAEKETRPGVDREPKEEDFPNDYFAYQKAANAWEIRQAIRDERQRDDQLRRQAAVAEARQELVDEYADHLETARERIPDFQEVVSRVNAKVPEELADEILSAGSKGPLIAYYLAQHPDKLSQLSEMNGKALAREVGRIAERVHLPQAKKATEASPPPTLPKGGAAPAFDPFKTDDMGAYVKWRKAGGGTKRASS